MAHCKTLVCSGACKLLFAGEAGRRKLVRTEYKADCWVFRVVGQRIPTAAGVATSAIFLQLELNGLSKLGSNPLDILRTSVPGNQVVNQPRNKEQARKKKPKKRDEKSSYS